MAEEQSAEDVLAELDALIASAGPDADPELVATAETEPELFEEIESGITVVAKAEHEEHGVVIHRTGQLLVHVIEASNLRAADATGFSDPYCDFFVWAPKRPSCKHMWRSETKMQTLSPVWNERQRVDLSTSDALLHVTVFDWDKIGGDDFLGEALVDLSQYADGLPHHLCLGLDQFDSSTSKEQPTGHITVTIQIDRAR